MDFLKKADFVGQAITLFTNKQTIYQTILGGLLSILVCLLTLGAGIFFALELWQRNNPIVNTSTEINAIPNPLQLDKIKWDFFFGVEDSHHVLYIDPTIYTIKGLIYTNHNNTVSSSEYNIEPCNDQSFSTELFPTFKQYYYNGAWCVSKNQTQTLQMNRLWGQEGFSFIEVSVWPCRNGSSLNPGVTCAPQEKINSMLNIATFAVYTTVYYFQSRNFESPYLLSIFNDFYSVSMKALSYIVIFLGHSKTVSDIGWLFQDNLTISSYYLDRVKTNFYVEPEASGRFLIFQFQLSNLLNSNSRSYLKIQQLAAQVGGVANILYIAGIVLNYFMSHFYLKEYLVNLYFDQFIGGHDEGMMSSRGYLSGNDNANIKLTKLKQEDNFTNNSNNKLTVQVSKFNNNVDNVNSVKGKEEEISSIDNKSKFHKSMNQTHTNVNNLNVPSVLYLPRRRKLQFTCFESLFFCCLSDKRENVNMLRTSFRLLRGYLSIENFLEITRTISKMRFFLFSPYENDLFNKIGNPTLNYVRSSTKSDNLFSQMSSFINKSNLIVDNSEVIEYKMEDMDKVQEELEGNPRLRKMIMTYNNRPESNRPTQTEILCADKKLFA